MKKVFLSVILACLALNLEPAALRQAARVGLVARAGVLRAPESGKAALQTLRAVSTTSQNKFFKRDSGKDWESLVGASIGALGVLGCTYALLSDSRQPEFLVEEAKFLEQAKANFNELSQLIETLGVDTGYHSPPCKRLVSELCCYKRVQLSDKQRDDLSVKFIERLLKYRLLNGHHDFLYYDLGRLLENIASDKIRNTLACRLLEHSKNFDLGSALFYFVPHVKDFALKNKWVVDCLESSCVGVYDLFHVIGSLKHLEPQDADKVARKILEQVPLYEPRIKKGLLNDRHYSEQEIEEGIERAISFIVPVSDKRRLMSLLLGHTDLFLANTSHVQEHPFFGEVNVVGDIGRNTEWLKFDRNRPGNFNHLLPLVAEHVAHEYEQDRMVYFHGQSSPWIFLTDMYQALEAMQKGTDFPEDFIPFRFTEKCPISDLKDAVKVGLPGYDRGKARAWVLFANLHLGANHEHSGSNTANFVIHNYDMSVMSASGWFKIQEKLTGLFNDHGLQEELEKFAADIEYVQSLFREAIEDQGNYGRLIVISMPKKTASEISYMAHPGGKIKKREIDGQETADPVKWAARYAECGLDNEVGICLTNDMLDPKKAKAAGITMQAFDPAIYWETEKAKKYKAALKDLMARIQASYQARKPQENLKE